MFCQQPASIVRHKSEGTFRYFWPPDAAWTPASESSGWDPDTVEQKQTFPTVPCPNSWLTISTTNSYFMPLSSGVVCYMAMDSQNRGYPEDGVGIPHKKLDWVKQVTNSHGSQEQSWHYASMSSASIWIHSQYLQLIHKRRSEFRSFWRWKWEGEWVSTPHPGFSQCLLSTYLVHESDTEQSPRPIGASIIGEADTSTLRSNYNAMS